VKLVRIGKNNNTGHEFIDLRSLTHKDPNIEVRLKLYSSKWVADTENFMGVKMQNYILSVKLPKMGSMTPNM
jgi:hypothetical protein